MKKKTALMFSFGSIICWAVSPVMIRYVKDFYSVSFQNFFRFAVSIIILWSFTLASVGFKNIFISLGSIKNLLPKLLMIALCNFNHQFFLIKGVYLLLPGLATIVEESTIVFAAALAFIFLPKERILIKNRFFIAGLLLAVGGVVLTSFPELSTSGSSSEGSPVAGIFFVLISSFAWALFSLMIKLWLPDIPAAVTSSLVFSLVIPFFLVSMLVSGGPSLLQADIPLHIWVILTASGIIGIGLGYSFYYQSIKNLGVTFSSSLSLLIPVLTALLSYLIFGEQLSAVQLAGSAVLLGGCLLIIRVRFSY